MNASRKVLLLNASEEIITVISWKRAVVLFVQGMVRKPYNYEEKYEIQTGQGVFLLPTALVLVKYVHIPYRNLALNKQNLLKRDNHECQYCGEVLNNSSATIDHVYPVSRGGKHKWKNVVIACMNCNNSKGDRTPEELGMELRRKPYVPSKQLLLVVGCTSGQSVDWKRWIEV